MVLTTSQARTALPELLTRVESGEQVTITRHGRAVAVLVRPDVLRARAEGVTDDAARIRQLLDVAADGEQSPRPDLTDQRAEDLIAHLRAGRNSR
jgi:antitoxin (DNA-binding transcriptional repressor) of toxin-antitoxin stability system